MTMVVLKCCNPFSVGTVFIRQNLTSVEVKDDPRA